MSPVEFSTLLAGWCEKHHFSNQRAAAAELGVSYGTLCGWLSRVRGLPCRLTREAVLRRMRRGCEPVAEASPSEVAAACKIWRAKNGLSQVQAAALLKWPPSMFRSIEGMTGRMTPLAVDEILHQIRKPVSAEEMATVKQRQRPVEPGVVAERLRQWRRAHRLNRRQAADALKAMGFATTARTVWVWESERMLPNRPLALLEKLAEKPPQTEPRREEIGRSFGKQLRQWRRMRGLNQRKALAILGEGGDQAKVSDWERGKMVPRNMSELLAKMEAAK